MKTEKPYQLIESFSGKTIATADSIEELRDHITEKLKDYYTVYHQVEKWFAPATILFKKEVQHQ